MAVSSVTILAPHSGFDSYGLRVNIDVVWAGGVGPFDVLYEWDDDAGFGTPITVNNIGVTSPDNGICPSNMGPIGTEWHCRATVTDNDDASSLTSDVNTIDFLDKNAPARFLYLNHNIGVGFGAGLGDDDSISFARYLYLNHNIGVGFGLDSFDNLPLGDGLVTDPARFLYLNHNITSDQPCPWLDLITPTVQDQGGTVVLRGDSFGATQATYTTEIRLHDTQSLASPFVLMTATSWSDNEIAVIVPTATTGWVAVVHTVGATCDGSALKFLQIIAVPAIANMGWLIKAVDRVNAATADATVLPFNIASSSFKKVMNGIGTGTLEIPLSDDVTLDSLLDPIMRKGTLIRTYINARMRYGWFAEELSHDVDELGNAVARISGRGMEVVAQWNKILPHDHPASPTRNPTWKYGSTENFISNHGFQNVVDSPILTNPGGEDGNIEGEDGNVAGTAKGWSSSGDGVTYIRAILDATKSRTDTWHIEVSTSIVHSGMTQSVPVSAGKRYHVRVYVQDPAIAGMRVTLALGGADDIAAVGVTYPNNFAFNNEILAELGNVASGTGATDGTYQVMDVEVITGPEQTSLTITIQNDDHGGIFTPFRVDDVEIEGWGLGIKPWVAYDAPLHATDSFRLSTVRGFNASTHSIYLDVDEAGPGIEQKISVNPNTKYTLTGYIWPTGTTDSWSLAVIAENHVLVRGFNAIVPVADQWNKMQFVYTTAADEDTIFVRFTYEGTAVVNPSGVWLDNFSLTPGEPASYAGVILTDVLDKMALVGKLTFLTRSWTATHDSKGVPWSAKISLDIEPSESLYDLLNRVTALGHEWEIVPTNFAEGNDTGFSLNLFNARPIAPTSGIGVSWESELGGPVITTGDATFSGRIVKTAFNVNRVMAIGEGGVWSESEQFPYETGDIPGDDPAPLGYKESFGIIEDVVTVSAADSTTISKFAEARLADEKGKERTVQLSMGNTSLSARPFLHFGVGDSLFVDMPPHNPDPPDATTGIRSHLKRVRAIQATLGGEGVEVEFTIDIDRVIHEKEFAWLALIAQLAERAPSDNAGIGTGSVAVAASTTSTPTTPTAHTHDLESATITNKVLSGDVVGELPGPLSVTKIKGQPISVTAPSPSRVLDPHKVAWVLDRDLLQWVPTELTDPHEGFFNGTFFETFRAVVTEAGGVVTLALDKVSGGDLTMRFSDGNTTLDTTPAITIALTTGSDAAPQVNYTYILQSTKALTKSTTAWPTTEHIKVAYFLVPSATFVAANGVYVQQNWEDESVGDTDQGHLADITERLRHEMASYHSGLAGAGASNYLTIVGTTVDLKIASGIVYQLHRQAVPAFDTSASGKALVKNWSGDAYRDITNLYDIVDDSTGTTIGINKYFNLVIWGVANESGAYDPVIINLPGGFYTSQADAENDVDGLDDFSIPREFNIDSSTGFLIARLTIQKKTTTWEMKSTTDLRGTTPQTAAGGAAGVATDFSDNQFSVFNVDDVTKEVALDVSGVATGTKRTWTVPNLDGLITINGVIPVKTDTGDPGSPSEGQMVANTFDNNVKIYVDGAWRILVTW